MLIMCNIPTYYQHPSNMRLKDGEVFYQPATTPASLVHINKSANAAAWWSAERSQMSKSYRGVPANATHEVTKQLERDCQQIIGVVNVLLRGWTCLSVAVCLPGLCRLSFFGVVPFMAAIGGSGSYGNRDQPASTSRLRPMFVHCRSICRN